MSEEPAGTEQLDLQRLLLRRAEGLRRFVTQKIPVRFKTYIAAEDVLQDVWISAFRSFADFRLEQPGAFDHWLMAIVNRRLADALRSAGAQKRGGSQYVLRGGAGMPTSWADLFAQLSADGKTPSGEISEQEALNALRIALGSLPKERRQAVYMRLIEGRSRSEVAQALQTSDAAVDRLVRQGLRDLRQCLRHASRFFSDTKSSANHGVGVDPPEGGSDG